MDLQQTDDFQAAIFPENPKHGQPWPDTWLTCSPDSLHSQLSLHEYIDCPSNMYSSTGCPDSPISLGSPSSPLSSAASSGAATSPLVWNLQGDFDSWTKADYPLANSLALVKEEPGSDALPFAAFPLAGDPLASLAIDPIQLSNSKDDRYPSARPSTMPRPPTSPLLASQTLHPTSPRIRSRDCRKAVRKHSTSASAHLSGTANPSRKTPSFSRPATNAHKLAQLSALASMPQHPPETQASSPLPSPPPKKTAHNLIEKRYRTNLNDKILALSYSVPSLRRLACAASDDDDDDDGGAECVDGCSEDTGLTPAHKLNKATILSKAAEYITYLERRNRSLARENAALRSKIDGFVAWP